MLDKLTSGVLHVSGAAGLRFVRLTFWERLRLLWVFRNFKILQQHVLPDRQRLWITSLCSRMSGYTSSLDREIACVIGTIIISEPAPCSVHDERRMAPRLPLPFEVRYGVGTELSHGVGCDLSETGVAFEGSRIFPIGVEVTLHYRLGSSSRESWTRTRGIVRNCAGRKMGLEFTIIHPRDRAQLRELTRKPVPPPDTDAIQSTDRTQSGAVACDGRCCAEQAQD